MLLRSLCSKTTVTNDPILLITIILLHNEGSIVTMLSYAYYIIMVYTNLNVQ